MLGLALSPACASTSPPPPLPPPTLTTTTTTPPPETSTAPPTLFARLGGQPAIEAVIDLFLKNVLADDRINHRFAYANFGHLRGQLIDQFCAASGGPCTYGGATMKAAHRGQKIDEAAWAALVDDLVRALDTAKVGAAEKGEILAALAPMHDDIVEVAP